jgi:hypothetical protein
MGVFLWRTNWLAILLFTGVPLIGCITLYLTMSKPESYSAGAEYSVSAGYWASQIAVLFIWWIKPLVDRFCLHVISVRFFEPRSSLRRLFRGLGKTLGTGIIGDLLWRRLSPSRSARMPLLVLERLKGKNYKRRKSLLARNGLGFGLPLTLICIGMALALNIGELIFAVSIHDLINGTNSEFFDFIAKENNFVSVFFL